MHFQNVFYIVGIIQSLKCFQFYESAVRWQQRTLVDRAWT